MSESNKYSQIFKNEVRDVPGKLNAENMDDYYAPDFTVINNGKELNYQQFKELHEHAFARFKSLDAHFDDIYEVDKRVSVRITFTQHLKTGESLDLHIAILAEFNDDDKICRMWQTMYPPQPEEDLH